MGMASTVLTAILAGWYCAIFAMPALPGQPGARERRRSSGPRRCCPGWLPRRDPELALNSLATLGLLVIAVSALALLRPPDSPNRPRLRHRGARLSG